MTDEPRDYDREYFRTLSGPLRARIGYDREKDDVVRFVVQVEYHHDGEWHAVVRYDHDGTGESQHAHDVTDEGLHIDIYREGEKDATEYIAPVESGSAGLNRAEDHLAKNLQRFIKRYERWHRIKRR